MSITNQSGTASYRIILAVIIVTAVVAVVMAKTGSRHPADTSPAVVSSPTLVPSPSLKPDIAAADLAVPNNEDNCLTANGDTATITIGPGAATPNCVIVTGTQHLQIVNSLHTAGTAMLGGKTMSVASSGTSTLPDSFSTYLAAGDHYLALDFYGGVKLDIWYQ